MAIDTFLKLDGVTGASTRKGHEKEIELKSWSWQKSQAANLHESTGGGAAKVSVGDLYFSAGMSLAGATLAQFCANGKHIATGKLTARKADGGAGLVWMTIEMEKIMVTSYATGGSGADPDENFSIQFAKYTHKYVAQASEGGAAANKQYTVDIPKNDHT